MYENGIGLRPDYVVAYAWYDIGSSEISLKGKESLEKKDPRLNRQGRVIG